MKNIIFTECGRKYGSDEVHIPDIIQMKEVVILICSTFPEEKLFLWKGKDVIYLGCKGTFT